MLEGNDLVAAGLLTPGMDAHTALENGAATLQCWVASTGKASQAVQECLEHVLCPCSPEAMKATAADFLASVISGRSTYCAMAIEPKEVLQVSE